MTDGSHLLTSDFNVKNSEGVNNIFRFAAPGTFWITNPDNIVENNIAAGSEGSGFWLSFMPKLYCDENGCSYPNGEGAPSPNIKPAYTALGAFNNNKAHSSVVGITVDGVPRGSLGSGINPLDRKIEVYPYRPPYAPTMTGLVSYKNSRTGLYYRGQRAIFDNAVLADNGASFFTAYDQELTNSLVVGLSENSCDNSYLLDTSIPESIRHTKMLYGVKIYDGPFYLRNVHFAGFDDITKRHYWSEQCKMPEKGGIALRLTGAASRYTNRVEQITFNEPPAYALYMNEATAGSWKDGHSAAIIDVDGSLGGTAGRILRPDSVMNDNHDCSLLNQADGLHHVLTCDYKVSHLRVKYGNDNTTKMMVTRIDHQDSNHKSANTILRRWSVQ